MVRPRTLVVFVSGIAPALRGAALSIGLFASAAAGCGGDKPAPAPEPAPNAEPSAAPTPAPAPAPAAQPAAPAVPDAQGVVHITGSDQMRFSTNRIEVKAGEKIKIELKNAGALPKEVMGHNLIVLKPGSDVNAFAAKAISAKATDYIPAGAPEVLGHTKLLGPGESATLELDALAAGTYPFLCSFPGHVGLMNGQLVVQ
jgi:azurin